MIAAGRWLYLITLHQILILCSLHDELNALLSKEQITKQYRCDDADQIRK